MYFWYLIRKVVLMIGLFFFSWSGNVLRAQTPGNPPYAEDYEFVSQNGAWCWFSDPRAVYVGDQMIGGFVDDEGSIWAFSYHPETQQGEQTKVYDKLDYDDHANPSVMKLPDDRIVIWFSGHGGTTNTPIFYRVSKRPADISEWEELQQISPKIPGRTGYCYTNAALLSEENNKIYLFFRGPDFKPDFVTTTDLKNWSEPQFLIKDEQTTDNVRPYMKVAHNGKDKIFFAFTDDHPRNRPDNSIYFMLYKGGKLYAADGRIISERMGEPVPTRLCDKVYDAKQGYDKAWIWDIAFDKDENPVIVYARFSSVAGEHSYWYAKWNGKKWTNRMITKAGQWFQRREYTKNNFEYECNYSGGVYLDHENPAVVYTSRPINNVFEIEKWTTVNDGKTWQTEAVTKESERDNVRPFVVRGHRDGQPSVLWMYNYVYPGFRKYHSALRTNQKAAGFDPACKKEAILKVGTKVANWQLNNFETNRHAQASKGWIAGTFYLGLNDWAELTGEKQYDLWLNKKFDRQYWQVGDRMYHADDICVGQVYLDIYKRRKEDKMITPVLARADWVIEHASSIPLKEDYGKTRWNWCDALFMAPAVYTRLYALTGDKKYMKFADREFKSTWEYLYDQDEKLFYRDDYYFQKREANGQKIFWGRGNGWVMGGLVEILKSLPSDDRKYRPFYESLFQEMAGKILVLQQEKGYWGASLLDSDSYPLPEMSATGFMVYALAYGINQGYLSREVYLPAVQKGWKALVEAVNTEGKLGWVQPVGSRPEKVTKKMTELYGTGAFLMAACEMYRLAD